jgi:hypothetical protein|tara:strand:+ start:550 stop:882 length:333 start_codon:yes stop_codon:yes gene_type:complete
MDNKELVPATVNLNAVKEEKLNESFLTMFGGAIETLLTQMFGHTDVVSTVVRGTPSQIASFGDALSQEKRYMETFLKHGLNDPRSFRTRHELEGAVANFEKETGIKWPFK